MKETLKIEKLGEVFTRRSMMKERGPTMDTFHSAEAPAQEEPRLT